MTLLTKQDIQENIKQGKLIPNGDQSRISTCSYDMTVGKIFQEGVVIDSTLPQGQRQIVVKPGAVVTMLTAEELHLPNDVAATAYAMNSQSSEGFLVLNPGHVDPGFVGPLEIKAINLRKVDLVLSIGDPIFTVVFQKLSKATQGYAHNKSLADRTREVRKKEVEKTVRSVSDLVELNGPFQTEEDVKKLIASHWMTWAMLAFTFVAMVGAVIAAFPVIHGDSNKPDRPEVIVLQPNGSPETPRSVDKAKRKDTESDRHGNKADSGK